MLKLPRKRLLRTPRNTSRKTKDLVGQPVEVRVLSSAPLCTS